MKSSCGCELKFRVGSGVCSFCRKRRGRTRCNPRRSFAVIVQEPRFLNAIQGMPVQVRLTAPIFKNPQHGGRQLAQQSLQNSAGSGQHRDAVPLFKSRGSQVGRQRPHKPSMSGFDSRPRYQFHGLLDHSGGHSPRKRESTVQSRGGPPFQNRGKVENHRSLISFFIVVRLHVPQPFSRGGSSLKTRAGL